MHDLFSLGAMRRGSPVICMPAAARWWPLLWSFGLPGSTFPRDAAIVRPRAQLATQR